MTIAQLICFSCAFSQNFLYNSDHFGIEGAMLGGAVIAGTNDVSMTYYNPAAIHMVASQVNISFLQPTVRTFGFKQFWGAGEENNINSDISFSPSWISFKLKVKGIDLALLRISRSDFSDSFSSKRESLQNDTLTTQFFEYEYSGRDRWYGFGTSFKLSPKLSFGISHFFSLASFTYENKILLEQDDLNPMDQSAQYFDFDQKANYSNIGMITKLGLLYDSEVHDLGLTITLPTYARLRRSGNFVRSVTNIGNEQSSSTQSIDTDLSPTIKTPLEVSLGYSLTLNAANKLWLSLNYHSEIQDYEMDNIQTATQSLGWMNGSEQVTNIGVGYSNRVNENLELSIGFRTNNLAYKNKAQSENTIRNVILDGNHYNVIFGTKFQYRKNTVLIGIDYGNILDSPEEENFSLITSSGPFTPNLENIIKRNVSVLITYGFVIDLIRGK